MNEWKTYYTEKRLYATAPVLRIAKNTRQHYFSEFVVKIWATLKERLSKEAQPNHRERPEQKYEWWVLDVILVYSKMFHLLSGRWPVEAAEKWKCSKQELSPLTRLQLAAKRVWWPQCHSQNGKVGVCKYAAKEASKGAKVAAVFSQLGSIQRHCRWLLMGKMPRLWLEFIALFLWAVSSLGQLVVGG